MILNLTKSMKIATFGKNMITEKKIDKSYSAKTQRKIEKKSYII